MGVTVERDQPNAGRREEVEGLVGVAAQPALKGKDRPLSCTPDSEMQPRRAGR